jgi:hypothetical protein
VRKLDQKLGKLAYLRVRSVSRINFVFDRAKIYLDLSHRKTDRFDGIIGFAPNTIDASQGLLITGEVNIELNNMFRRGVAFSTHWKNFQARSQHLEMQTMYPYLAGSSVGVDGEFSYLKFDTLYFTLKSQLGLRYLFEGTDFLRFYYQNNSTNLLYVDTVSVRNSKKLPSSNPVTIRSYGVELSRQKLDYPFNPRSGYRIRINGNIGTRNLLRDLRIEQVVFKNAFNQDYTVYDSARLKSTQVELNYKVGYFMPLGKKSTVLAEFSGYLLQANQIFFNDLHRLGGTRTLRGFNEESLLVSSFHMATFEYRYLFSENAFFQVFFNGALTENRSVELNEIRRDKPIGFGLGINLEVNGGILSLAYALGREQGNPIQLSQAKIHFGIVNYL